MSFKKHVLAGLLVIASYSHGSPVGAASFDCTKTDLKADEKTICENRALNDQDVRMATTFEILTQLMAMGARDSLKTEQSEWLKTRETCAADTECLTKSYDDRMKKLGEAFQNINRPL
ncbi:lysozyme inhibitor LprI family protein [Agrobacterium sp. CG674]